LIHRSARHHLDILRRQGRWSVVQDHKVELAYERQKGQPHEHTRNGPILVTGGTGTLGRLVVPRLQDAGSKVRVLSRRNREAGEGIELMTGDLATGEGIEAAAEGAVADSGLHGRRYVPPSSTTCP
jgi:NAD dependent epimerase/dehydratase family